MAILGFVVGVIFLIYLLFASVAGIYVISCFGGNTSNYIFPLLLLCFDIYLWTVLITHSPFTITLL